MGKKWKALGVVRRKIWRDVYLDGSVVDVVEEGRVVLAEAPAGQSFPASLVHREEAPRPGTRACPLQRLDQRPVRVGDLPTPHLRRII